MALTKDLYNLLDHAELRCRVTQMGMIVAMEVVQESPATENHTNRLKWAIAVLGNPEQWGVTLLRVLIAKYWTLTTAQIVGVTDTVENQPTQGLIGAVRGVVDTFANNMA
jgi:hypothetical protein